jgi:hypothetical protein
MGAESGSTKFRQWAQVAMGLALKWLHQRSDLG